MQTVQCETPGTKFKESVCKNEREYSMNYIEDKVFNWTSFHSISFYFTFKFPKVKVLFLKLS